MKTLYIIAILLLLSFNFLSQEKNVMGHPYIETISKADTLVFPDNRYITIINGNKQKRIVASYAAISCPCAQWKVEGENENVYLERENEKLQDANELWDGETMPFKVAVKGKFKDGKGIPKGFTTKGAPKPAKIFIYSQLEVLQD